MGALQHGFHKLTNWNNDFKVRPAPIQDTRLIAAAQRHRHRLLRGSEQPKKLRERSHRGRGSSLGATSAPLVQHLGAAGVARLRHMRLWVSNVRTSEPAAACGGWRKRGARGRGAGHVQCSAAQCSAFLTRVSLRFVLAQPKRAGYRNGSGMDMFDFQLEKRDEQLLACDGDWTKFHQKPAAH